MVPSIENKSLLNDLKDAAENNVLSNGSLQGFYGRLLKGLKLKKDISSQW